MPLEYNNLPKKIKSILNTYDDEKSLYDECLRIKKHLELEGWTCEYGLDGDIFNIKMLK